MDSAALTEAINEFGPEASLWDLVGTEQEPQTDLSVLTLWFGPEASLRELAGTAGEEQGYLS